MPHRWLCAGPGHSLPITDPLTSGGEAWDLGLVLPPTCHVTSQRSLNPTEALFSSSVKWKLILPLIIFSDPHILTIFRRRKSCFVSSLEPVNYQLPFAKGICQ